MSNYIEESNNLFSSSLFPSKKSNPETGLDDLLKLRSILVLDHPLTHVIGSNPSKIFLMFELYADFVYDFTEYVCRLFISLHDDDMKATIYENLIDEMGIGSRPDTTWKAQHGELYRQFLNSLRELDEYKKTRLNQCIENVKHKAKAISRRFYEAHAEIIDEGDDVQSLAAFSTIECWVCDLYSFWKESLIRIVQNFDAIDMRTIDLHCVCDVEHSAALDELLKIKLHQGAGSIHRIKTGITRGIIASEQLFSDICRELA